MHAQKRLLHEILCSLVVAESPAQEGQQTRMQRVVDPAESSVVAGSVSLHGDVGRILPPARVDTL